MNIKADSILNVEEIEFIASLAVMELEADGVVIEYYDPESDNPYVEQSSADFDRETSNRLMAEYRKAMEDKELLDNPFE